MFKKRDTVVLMLSETCCWQKLKNKENASNEYLPFLKAREKSQRASSRQVFKKTTCCSKFQIREFDTASSVMNYFFPNFFINIHLIQNCNLVFMLFILYTSQTH